MNEPAKRNDNRTSLQPGRPCGVVLHADAIRLLRARVGITQEELAQQMGVTTRTICSAESRCAVSLRTARGIAMVLSVPLQELIELR